MKVFKNCLFTILFLFILSTFSYADDLFQDEFQEFDFRETSADSVNKLNTNSKHIIAIDRKTHTVLYEKDGYSKTAMASTTKIMTCILALENLSLEDIVTVSKNASSIHGSTLGLNTNDKISVRDLLYGLMLRSGNDCAISIAEQVSGNIENFAILMNNKAKDLNLLNTNFVTPNGLDYENHYTTAYDLAILTDYALKSKMFREIVSTKNCSININGIPQIISNTNELLGNLEGVYGVKTGFTFNAGRCLVSSCKRGEMDIIVVVLGADTKNIRTKDSCNIINYIFKNYAYIDLSNTINEAFKEYLHYNKYVLEKTTTKPELYIELDNNYEFPINTQKNNKFSTKVYIQNKFSFRTLKDSKVGTLYLYNEDNLLCEIDIKLKNELIKNSWKFYFKNIFKNLF